MTQSSMRQWCMTANTPDFQSGEEGSNPSCRINLELVENETQRFNFNQIVKIYHTYKKGVEYVGRRVDYLVKNRSEVIGAIGLGCPIIAMKPRDDFIGWNEKQRLKNLTKIGNNWRFCLIDKGKGYGSMTLSKFISQVPKDYEKSYGDKLVMIETLIEKPYTGSCYKATGFTYLGETAGFSFEVVATFVTKEQAKKYKIENKIAGVTRTFKDGETLLLKPISSTPKLIFVKPLHRYFKKILCEKEDIKIPEYVTNEMIQKKMNEMEGLVSREGAIKMLIRQYENIGQLA